MNTRQKLIGLVHTEPREFVSVDNKTLLCNGEPEIAQLVLGQYVACCRCGFWKAITEGQYQDTLSHMSRQAESSRPILTL